MVVGTSNFAKLDVVNSGDVYYFCLVSTEKSTILGKSRGCLLETNLVMARPIKLIDRTILVSSRFWLVLALLNAVTGSVLVDLP